MAKKKTTQKFQLLSPENYIRQRSRNLPMHGCWINSDWQDKQMATILIARKHASGNITCAVYLVDLLCLGIKDTFFRYNILESDFDDFMENPDDELGFENISYNHAHNIIYTAIEYAEEYGFKPHKEFTQTTQYLLEEDTDDIPIIEVTCGDKDGKPLYIRGDLDSPARVKQILAQLEKTAGEGNYHYILNVDDELDEDEDDDEDEDEETAAIERELADLSDGELKKLFLELIEDNNENTDEEVDKKLKRLFVLTNMIIEKIIDEDIIDDYYEELEGGLNIETVVEDECMPNSLFQGIQNDDGETVSEIFFNAIESIANDDSPKKVLKETRDMFGDVPVSDYLDFRLQLDKHNGDVSKCGKKITEYHQKHSEYFLFELYWYEYLYLKNNDEDALKQMKELLHQTTLPLTEFEYAEFVSKYVMYCYDISDEDISFEQIIAIEDFVQDRLLSYQPATIGLLATVTMLKLARLSMYLNSENGTI
jgi:AAA ATPase containing von Willebrand factor type A (vWA) domain